jgi:hypothetical protein
MTEEEKGVSYRAIMAFIAFGFQRAQFKKKKGEA